VSNNSNIQLRKDVNFSEIEKLALRVLSVHPEKMQIPNSLSYSGGFGMEGAALQLLATWLRTPGKHILHTGIQELESEKFEGLCNSLFGLCSLRLSDSVLLSTREEVGLSDALRPAISIFKNIRNEDLRAAFKGMYVALPAIKSPLIRGGRDREFDSPLYNNEEVVSAQKFSKLTKKAIDVIAPRASEINPTVVAHISEILRELFVNTHRHGRSDVFGNPLGRNFRGIIFNSLNVTGERLDVISKSGGGKLALFVTDWRPSKGEHFKAIDITVVDSGPGYARRWQGLDKNELTIEMEKDAVIKCFSKHRSTDNADSSGSGLSNVLRDLKAMRGWLRLRTGRTLVEKSFFNHSGSVAVEYDDIKEMDVFMEGVVFNVVIPLNTVLGGR